MQIATFSTFYLPWLSTFAVMLKRIERKEAFFSVGLSVAVALGRFAMPGASLAL